MTFDTFDLSVFIETDPEDVASAFTKSGVQENWFVARSNFVDPSGNQREPQEPCGTGDSYWWEWYDQSVETGIITAAGMNLIEFTFGKGVSVMVNWEGVHDGTQVVLSQVHSEGDLDSVQRIYCSCHQSWTFYLTNLKAFLEHGLDLREKAPTRRDHVNV